MPIRAVMSAKDPVDIVQAAWRRYAEGGIPDMLRYLAEDVAFHPHDEPDRPLRGHDAVVEYGRALKARGVRVEAVGHRFEGYDDCVVVIGRVRVLSAGGHYDMPMFWQADVADGRITCVRAERRVEDARDRCDQPAAA